MHPFMSVALAVGIAWAVPTAAAAAQRTSASVAANPAHLTPAEAVARALEVSPRVASAVARLRATEGELTQAGALPNPELGVEVENFGGSGTVRGFRSAETTLGLSQPVELGGKRAARINAARASQRAAEHDLAAVRLDLSREVRVAFTEAVAATEEVRLAEERVRLAREVERSVVARVEAGREPPLQSNRSQIARRQAEVDLEGTRRRAGVARRQLTRLVGPESAALDLDTTWFARVDTLPLQIPEDALPVGTPDLLRREADVLRGRAELEVERRRAIPDVTVSAGVRRFRESDDTAFIAGVSIPIPVFNRNRGAIASAGARMAGAESDLAAERLELSGRLGAVQARLLTAQDNAIALKESIVPTAERAFTIATEGYRQGKFSYLEVLDAQRTLFDARRDLTSALATYHDTAAELDRLTRTAVDGVEK